MSNKLIIFGIMCAVITTGCSYVRPPAGEGVKDVDDFGMIYATGNENTGIVQQDNTASIKRSQNPISERAKGILSHLKLPEGFEIEIFAEVPNARSLASAEDKQRNRFVVFVGNKDKSSVYAIIDENSDYTVDRVKIIVDDWKMPNGVAFKDGNLYVAQISKIHEFTDILNNLGEADTPPSKIIYDKLPTDLLHGWKYIAFGPDGDLYIPVGAPCNVCDRELPYESIFSLNLKTMETKTIAQGIRNTVGFARHPDTLKLWFTDNGRDLLGENIPPDELNVVEKEGEDFGFPFCWGTGIPDPISSRSDCVLYSAPQVLLGAHVAALGMKFYSGPMFPDNFQNQIFIAEHGSRNKKVPDGYRVMLVDTQKKSYDVFIDGRLSEGKTRGRPVDILQMPDGSLLISDDYAGLVYRVVYTEV